MDVGVIVSSGGLAITLGAHLLSCGLTAHRQFLLPQSRRNALKTKAPVPAADSLTIIRPLCGLEPFAEEALRSTFDLEGAENVQIIFCVDRADDPIISVAKTIMAQFPHRSARLLTGQHRISANPKLNNIEKGWREATTDWIAFIDSNVILPVDALHRLFEMNGSTVGMICSPPIGSRPLNFAAEIEAAFLNGYQARWQCAADTLGNGFAQGKVMLFRRELIDASGGLSVLGTEPAEDAASTILVRRKGLRVRLVDKFFEQPLGLRSWSAVWQRQVRWARLRRASFPLQFAAEILTGVLPPALLSIVLAHSTELSPAALLSVVLLIWYGAEALLAQATGWTFSFIAAVFRDLLLPMIWVQGWLSRTFEWRGHSMRAEALSRTPDPGIA
jgi:ceramide glucosyltransferase